MKYRMDDLDLGLTSLLTEDGRAGAGEVATGLGVTSPTVRTRMKNLIARGVLRVAGLLDPFRAKGFIVALVCLNVESHGLLGEKLDQVAALNKVNWAAVVTGRYDIMAEVVISEEIGDLHRFVDEELSKVGGIRKSETFVVMDARRKWILLPEAALERRPEKTGRQGGAK